jgi:hypothetical protein
VSAPDLVRLTAWDSGPVRGALANLADVAGRLPRWRFRLETVGRQLESASSWSGPAAAEAAAAVIALATVTESVTRACLASLSSLDRLAVHAAAARELAEQALTLAAGADVELDGDGGLTLPVPSPARTMAADQAAPLLGRATAATRASALAIDALRRGSDAATAAVAADDALHQVGVVDAWVPVSFADLAFRVGTGSAVRIAAAPAGRAPGAVAAWWTSLTAAEERAAIAAEPRLLGGLDGVPAWARDRANRILLARALHDPGAPGYDVAVTVAGTLAGEAAAGRTAQLYEFAPRDGLVGVALGDLDTAAAVGVLVPGMRTTVTDDFGALLHDADDVADAAHSAAPGIAVATMAWLGYRTPQSLIRAASRHDARTGGRLLDGTLGGLTSARAATPVPAARTTVLAHSYGTVVVDEAAHRPGRLAVDAVVLMGSPGMGRDGAAGLEAPEVYDAAGGDDPVARLEWFGEAPREPGYGAIQLPTDSETGHTEYYDRDHPTLAALGQVVAGSFRPG